MVLAALAPAQSHAGVFINSGNDWASNGTSDAVSCTVRDSAGAARLSTDPVDEIHLDVPSTLYRTGANDDNTAGDIDLCKPVTGGKVLIKGSHGISVQLSGQVQEVQRDRIFHVQPSTKSRYILDLRLEDVVVGLSRVVDQAVGGGCVASHGGSLEMVDSSVTDCKVTNTGHWGPSVRGGDGLQAHGALLLEGPNILPNEAIETNGGAIEALANLTVDHTFIHLNDGTTTGAAARGGVIHAPGTATVTFLASRIYSNSAPGRGGRLWLAPSQLSIVDTEVFNNEATLGATAGGGSLFLVDPEDQGCDPIMEGSLFADNRAATTNACGGGICFAGATNDPLRFHNEGHFGGLLFVGTEAMVVGVHHGGEGRRDSLENTKKEAQVDA